MKTIETTVTASDNTIDLTDLARVAGGAAAASSTSAGCIDPRPFPFPGPNPFPRPSPLPFPNPFPRPFPGPRNPLEIGGRVGRAVGGE